MLRLSRYGVTARLACRERHQFCLRFIEQNTVCGCIAAVFFYRCNRGQLLTVRKTEFANICHALRKRNVLQASAIKRVSIKHD